MALNWDDIVCIIPIITPFNDDYSVDEDGLRALVDYLIDKQSAHAIVPCGTTGESPTLSHQEHIRVIEIVVDAVAGRVPVIAGAGSNSTREAISEATVATMKTPVPQKMPARALTTKKTTSGPTSTSSFRSCPRNAAGSSVLVSASFAIIPLSPRSAP